MQLPILSPMLLSQNLAKVVLGKVHMSWHPETQLPCREPALFRPLFITTSDEPHPSHLAKRWSPLATPAAAPIAMVMVMRLYTLHRPLRLLTSIEMWNCALSLIAMIKDSSFLPLAYDFQAFRNTSSDFNRGPESWEDNNKPTQSTSRLWMPASGGWHFPQYPEAKPPH